MKAWSGGVGPVTAAGTYTFEALGVVLASHHLVITGTATAALEVELGENVWSPVINATSSSTWYTSNYAVGRYRLNVSAYTNGDVAVYSAGVR